MSKAIMDIDESKLGIIDKIHVMQKDDIMSKLNQVASILDELASKYGVPMICLSCNYFNFTTGGLNRELESDFNDFTMNSASVIGKERIARARQWKEMKSRFIMSA